jgi:oxygen-independent coproporphyrinogen-3 oxidase
VSADLIFGTPGQSAERLRDELGQLVDLGVRHVSTYGLTIEPGTPFFEMAKKNRLAVVSDDDTLAELFDVVSETLEPIGFSRYEVSNLAVPGEEARHNLHYWRGGAYLGLGAAAVGCLDVGVGLARRYRNEPDATRYMDAGGDPNRSAFTEDLGPTELIREALMLGLRTQRGVDLADVERRSGRDPRDGRMGAITRRVESGDLIDDGASLRVPPDRFRFLDGIVADLF